MPLYRRGRIWYIRFAANGRRVNRSARTSDREKAERLEARLRHEIWNQQELGERPAHIWQEAVTSWIKAKQHKRSLDDDLRKLEWLAGHFNDEPLTAIDSERIEETLDHLDVSNATRNRYAAVIRGVLKRAHRLNWIQAVPAIDKREEAATTPRYLTQEQAAALLAKLDTPRRRHLYDMVRFSLATGMREANVTGLRWSRVNLDGRYAYIAAERAKGKRTIRVPLNSAAMAVLESRAGIHRTHVFSYRGKPVRKANRDGFQEAKAEAGLPWLRWHDLRHTWASWHVMAGTPLAVLRELGGWADLTMVMRYAHLAPDFAEQYAENVAQKVLHPPTAADTKKVVND